MQSVCYSLDFFLLSNQKIIPIFIVHILCYLEIPGLSSGCPPKKLWECSSLCPNPPNRCATQNSSRSLIHAVVRNVITFIHVFFSDRLKTVFLSGDSSSSKSRKLSLGLILQFPPREPPWLWVLTLLSSRPMLDSSAVAISCSWAGDNLPCYSEHCTHGAWPSGVSKPRDEWKPME